MAVVITWVILSLPWGINLFYGLDHAMSGPAIGGKARFVQLYQALCVWPPAPFGQFCSFTFLSTAIVLAIELTLRPRWYGGGGMTSALYTTGDCHD